MLAMLILVLPFLHVHVSSAALAFLSVSSTSYLNQVPDILPLRVLKLPFVVCNRRCALDSNCWSWYVNHANGTDNCVLMDTNLRQQPSLALVTASLPTRWWEKVPSISCAVNNSNTSTVSPPLPQSTCINPTSYDIPVNTTCTSMISTLTAPLPAATCTLTFCISCQACVQAKCCIQGPNVVDRGATYICIIWPNGIYGPSITMLCVETIKPVLLYRKVQVDTTNVTEFVLTPQQMHWAAKSYPYSTFEIRYRTVASGNYTRANQYKSFSISPAGSLRLANVTCCPGNADPFGVPLINITFVCETVNPACGPFWNLKNSSVANNGTAFDACPCPGYRTGFYGKPGFYNGSWRSGIALASIPNETIIEIFLWVW